MGQPLPSTKLMDKVWDCIEKADGCWRWTGSSDRYGYAARRFLIDGKQYTWKIHRLIYTVEIGEIPDGMSVCHSCDNPGCVNPSHLWLGTHTENMKDRDRKSRGVVAPKGERNALSKLTEQQVREMRRRRASGESLSKLAIAFRISPHHLSNICRRKYWKHVA